LKQIIAKEVNKRIDDQQSQSRPSRISTKKRA